MMQSSGCLAMETAEKHAGREKGFRAEPDGIRGRRLATTQNKRTGITHPDSTLQSQQNGPGDRCTATRMLLHKPIAGRSCDRDTQRDRHAWVQILFVLLEVIRVRKQGWIGLAGRRPGIFPLGFV